VVRGTDRFGGRPSGRAGLGRGGRPRIAVDRCCGRRPNARRLSGRRARDAGGTPARGGSSSASPHARRPPGERDRPRSSPTGRACSPPGGSGRRSDRRGDAPTAPRRRARAAGGDWDRFVARTRRRRGRGLAADTCRCAADRRASRVADGSRDRARGRAAQRPRRADARAAPPRSPCRSPCAGASIGDPAGSSSSRRGVDPQSATTSEHGVSRLVRDREEDDLLLAPGCVRVDHCADRSHPEVIPSPAHRHAIVAALLRRSASASSEHPELGCDRDRDH
jgi:hypothetical protein